VFLCAVIRAVDIHADLLRGSIASAGNDHRLGANEAPPAIISIFLGDMLTDLVNQLEKGATTRTLKGGQLDLGATTLAQIPRDSGDRNRTSPFAFTGNRFEFRAVGSSATSAWPNTVMNTIVAESLDSIATRLEDKIGTDRSLDNQKKAVREVLQDVIRNHKRVIFNGDGYSDAWQDEAASRGLPNLKDSVDAIPCLGSDVAVKLFSDYKVLQPEEVKSRVNASLEKYAKQLLIESETMVLIGRQMILPAALKHQTILANAVGATEAAGVDCGAQKEMLTKFVDLTQRFEASLTALAHADNHETEDLLEHAHYMKRTIAPMMDSLRDLGDQLEAEVSAELWPLPSYRDLLYVK
jgi:glutamine synthetase